MHRGLGLEKLEVKAIEVAEIVRWDALMKEHHYLGFRKIVGESIKYVATIEDEWVALLGWGTAAYKCSARDEWIGWSKGQQWKRLKYIANNSRFLILPGVNIPNLASKALALVLRRLSDDWQDKHGHPILLAETFVDQGRFQGTCYIAANWKKLGQTQGYGRNAGKYYHHGKIKTIFVYPLHKKTQEILSSCFLAPELTGGAKPMVDLNKANLGNDGGLLWHFFRMVDHRFARGKRHKLASILAVAACAVICGYKSYSAMGEFSSDLSQEMLERLGCYYHDEKQMFIHPSEPTIRRALQKIDADEFDREIGMWVAKQTDPDAVAVDGKIVKGAKDEDGNQLNLMSAVLHKKAVVVSQVEVPSCTNEITRFQAVLDDVNIEGKVVTADAMHTQIDHANYLVEEKGADYFFVVKGNQPTLKSDIETLDEGDFSPCTHRTQ